VRGLGQTKVEALYKGLDTAMDQKVWSSNPFACTFDEPQFAHYELGFFVFPSTWLSTRSMCVRRNSDVIAEFPAAREQSGNGRTRASGGRSGVDWSLPTRG